MATTTKAITRKLFYNLFSKWVDSLRMSSDFHFLLSILWNSIKDIFPCMIFFSTSFNKHIVEQTDSTLI